LLTKLRNIFIIKPKKNQSLKFQNFNNSWTTIQKTQRNVKITAETLPIIETSNKIWETEINAKNFTKKNDRNPNQPVKSRNQRIIKKTIKVTEN